VEVLALLVVDIIIVIRGLVVVPKQEPKKVLMRLTSEDTGRGRLFFVEKGKRFPALIRLHTIFFLKKNLDARVP